MDHPVGTDERDERRMLSIDSKLSSEFAIFAQRFIDYKILFSNGKPVATNKPLDVEFEEITKDNAPALLWSIEPFTAKFWSISFPELGDTIHVGMDTDDSTAVLNYKIIGTTDWFKLDSSSPLTISTPCDGLGADYDFLLSSTADSDSSVGSITFTVVNKPCDPVAPPISTNGSTTCNDIGIPVDPCLLGNWVLDDTSMQAVLQKAEEAAVPGAVVSVKGAASFDVTSPNSNVITYNDMEFDVTAPVGGSGPTFTTTVKFTGTVNAQIANQGPNSFCWMNPVATGTTSMCIDAGSGCDPVVIPIGDGYTSPGLVIDYKCDASTLSMSGVLADGKTAWQYAWTKSGVA